MKSHFAWRPHLDGGLLFNPFVPSERTPTLGHVELAEAYGDEVVDSAEQQATPPEIQPGVTDEPPSDAKEG
jgi:hypothetical protein